METLARRQLAEAGFPEPSTQLLRARLMLDHAKAARDLGHSFPEMLTLSAHDLAVLEAAEDHSRRALLAITAAAKRNA